MDTNKYIKKLVLETIKANISASKDKLITESKDYSFTKDDVVRQSRDADSGIPELYIKVMDVYETMKEAEPQVLPLIAQTSNETPKEFANRIFPAYKAIFDKKFIELISPGAPNRDKRLNEKLFPIYKIIHGILLEAIEFACFEFMSEINFEAAYDETAPLFTFDEKIYEEAMEKGRSAAPEYDTDVQNAFHILRDDPGYYNVKYTFAGDTFSDETNPDHYALVTPGLSPSTPFYRLETTFYLSPYQDFFRNNTWLATDSDLSYGLALADVLY